MELTGTFRWRSADTLDLETTIKTPLALPRLELFLSNYFVEGFDALVYVKRNRYGGGEPAGLLRADWSPLLDGNYLMFPRDEDALRMIYDGRWDIPPNPVTWAFLRWLGGPAGRAAARGSGSDGGVHVAPGRLLCREPSLQ